MVMNDKENQAEEGDRKGLRGGVGRSVVVVEREVREVLTEAAVGQRP